MQAAMTPLQDAWNPNSSSASPWAAATARKNGGGWAPPIKTSSKAFATPTSKSKGVPIPFVDYDGEMSDVTHYCKTYGVVCEKSPAAKDLRKTESSSGSAPNHRIESFAGLTEDELNDVFVPVSRPQVSASFVDDDYTSGGLLSGDPLVPPLLLNPGVPGGDGPFPFSSILEPSTLLSDRPRAPAQAQAQAQEQAPVQAQDPEPQDQVGELLGSFPKQAIKPQMPVHGPWTLAGMHERLTRLVGSPEALNLVLFALAGLMLIFVLDQMVRLGVELAKSRAYIRSMGAAAAAAASAAAATVMNPTW